MLSLKNFEGTELLVVYRAAKIAHKVIIQEPTSITVRIEEETRNKLDEFCKRYGMKPITVAGMLLDAGIQDFVALDEAERQREQDELEAECKLYEAEMEKEKKKPKKDYKNKVELDIKGKDKD